MKGDEHPRGRAATIAVLVACAVALALVVVLSGASSSPLGPTSAPPTPALPATLHALGDLAPGMPLGPYLLNDVTEPASGAVLVHASSPAGGVTYEVRLLSDRPLPAARTAKYAVYYRGTDGGADVLAGAAALAALLERGPRNEPALPGITQYPTVFTSL